MTEHVQRQVVECPDADTVAALVADALPEATRAAIADHAASCARCHDMLAALIGDLSRARTTGPDDTTRDDVLAGSERALRPGTRVGRYTVESRVGAGGMGVVYAAVDSELHRRVAIKLLRRDGDDRIGSQGRERLLREARTLASLSHPNVVTVFDVGTHAGDLFLAMELVDGGSLAAWLRGASHTADEIIDRLIEAGRGLAAANAAGVVHRDVKPDNVLVGRDGRARVTDFGLARSVEAPVPEPTNDAPAVGSPFLTRTGALLGTPAYMAPEQQVGGRAIDARTDQWAFCATLYEALAGVRPFPGDDPAARIAAIDAGKIAPPAAGRIVPAWVRPIVARGLRANPAERWPDVAAVVAALVRGRSRRGRRRAAIAAGGVVAVGLGVVGTIALASDRTTPVGALPPDSAFKENDYSYVWKDFREGCDCPFSACENGTCLSVCSNARGYAFDTVVPGIGNNSVQDIVLGVSYDGDTILYLSGEGCRVDRLMIARSRGDTYVPIDLTDQLDRSQVDFREGCCTMATDARSMILRTPDIRGFVRIAIDGDTLGPPDRRPFEALRVADGQTVTSPVLSHDQRTLYFDVHGTSGYLEEPNVHVAERTDPSAPFSTATRLPGLAQRYEYVSGISSDNLTLFMAMEFETRVLSRATTDGEFIGPFPGALPNRTKGWRVMPVGDCDRLLSTYTPGGCHAEEITWMRAVR